EAANVAVACARVLYINGQSTDETLAAAERLGGALGLRAILIPRWGELELQAESGSTRLVAAVDADPTGVEMDRVASMVRAMEDVNAGRLESSGAMETVSAISHAPPAPTWLFVLSA